LRWPVVRRGTWDGREGRCSEGPDQVKETVKTGHIPRHVAIIMDGNGRWARQRGLPRTAGHRAGAEALREVVKTAAQLGIEILTLYAFSTENWKRPRAEVEALMGLLVEYLGKELDRLVKEGVRIQVIGHPEELPPQVRSELERALEATRSNDGLLVNLALNYGGRREIADAIRAIVKKALEGNLRLEDIDEGLVQSHLYTAGLPDPDLLIRPSGEMRVSNFLLWQIAYTEFWVTDVLWPDFRPYHLLEAVRAYQARDRRFGGL